MRRWMGGIMFLSLGVLIVLMRSFSQRVILRQKATADNCRILVDTTVSEPLNRNWDNYAQGGEEKALMLQPVFNQIAFLKPKYIRIDHLFDYPNMGLRLLEIKRLGAVPYISLSYFPPTISDELTKMPISLSAWTDLIAKTTENISRQFDTPVYFEVWNEPDLFGNFSPEQYYQLYRATVEGFNQCHECISDKIGGPAITTIKTAWMERFLNLVIENKTRLDFVSWHSYQKDPNKTVTERTVLLGLDGFQKLKKPVEIIVSEWGITPENSYLNDDYESASHTVAVISGTLNKIDKLFAFELKDGLDPQKKQYWGRWGLLTHQELISLPKPRYHAFSLLNQLGGNLLTTRSSDPQIYSISTLDYPANYATLITSQNTACQQVQVDYRSLLSGNYEMTTYSLDSLHDPLKPVSQRVDSNQQNTKVDIPTSNNGVYLVKLNRKSAGSLKGPGKSGVTNDYSARIGQNAINIDYPVINGQTKLNTLEMTFWLKVISDTGGLGVNYYPIVGSTNQEGFGFELGIERLVNGSQQLVVLRSIPGNREEKIITEVTSIDLGQWHRYTFSFNNTTNLIFLSLDGVDSTTLYKNSWPTELGNKISFGGSNVHPNSIEGYLDEVVISLPENTPSIQDNFD